MSFERIRKIENDLETGQVHNRGRSMIHDIKIPQVVDSWNDSLSAIDENMPELAPVNQVNWFKRIFTLSLLFALFGGIFFAISVFFSPGNISEKNVILQMVTSHSVVDGGESFPVTVTITNKNKVPIEYLKLSIEYPLTPGGDISGLYQEKTIDTLAPGEVKDIPFSITLYGSAGSQRTISARLSYRTPGSVAILESLADTQIAVRSSPVRLVVDAPNQVFPNQEINLSATYASNLKDLAPSSMLQIQYPTGFRFISADPRPDVGDNVWKVGTLVPGIENTISIKGILGGVLGEEKIFSTTLGSVANNQTDFESIYTTATSRVVIQPTFLSVLLDPGALSQSGEVYVTTPGKELDIKIPFKNTLTTPISRAKITAAFSGNIFNPDKLRPGNGFYDSDTNMLTWTMDEIPSLGNIPAGGVGELDFGLSELSTLDGDGKIITDPKLSIVISVEGVGENGKRLSAAGITKADFTFSTQPTLVSTLLSTRGPIKNTGSYPPTVGKDTTYTVAWKLSNTLSDITNTTVTTKIPQWVRYTGMISPQSAKDFITYNETSRTITWSPGLLAASSGYTKPELVVYFQVAIKPSSSQLGTTPALTGPVVFTGRDQKNGASIQLQNDGLNTASSGEKGTVTK